MSLLANGNWKIEGKGYSDEDARAICRNKLIVFVGDSLVRGMYKDLVYCLTSASGLVPERLLKIKGEKSYEGDRLIEGGELDGLFNGPGYIEVREYRTNSMCIRFYFVTRCYYDYMETILQDFMEEPVPDAVFMSSCLWDVTRWSDEIKSGPNALCKYKANLEILFTRFREVLPKQCVVIWGCCMPMGEHVRGGFMDPAMKYQEKTLRLDILEANYYASQLAGKHELDVIDYHWYFRHFQESRKADGIHWNSPANRNMTFMLLYHLTQAWGMSDIVPQEKYAKKMKSESSGLSHYQWPRFEEMKSRNPPFYFNHDTDRTQSRPEAGNKYKIDHKRRFRNDNRDVPYKRGGETYNRDGNHGDRRHRMNQERFEECQMFDRMLQRGFQPYDPRGGQDDRFMGHQQIPFPNHIPAFMNHYLPAAPF